MTICWFRKLSESVHGQDFSLFSLGSFMLAADLLKKNLLKLQVARFARVSIARLPDIPDTPWAVAEVCAPAPAQGQVAKTLSLRNAEDIPSGFIKHGWLENPRTEWRF